MANRNSPWYETAYRVGKRLGAFLVVLWVWFLGLLSVRLLIAAPLDSRVP